MAIYSYYLKSSSEGWKLSSVVEGHIDQSMKEVSKILLKNVNMKSCSTKVEKERTLFLQQQNTNSEREEKVENQGMNFLL